MITLILEYFDQPLIPDNLTNKPVVPDLGGAGVNWVGRRSERRKIDVVSEKHWERYPLKLLR